MQASSLDGIERALVLPDLPVLARLLHADPAAATTGAGTAAGATATVDRPTSRRPRHGVDVNAVCCLHHAIARGRGLGILTMLLDAGADPNLPWTRWDVGRRPLAARCGHLAAYELLAARGAAADLDAVDAAVLAVARGESVRLPAAPPPAKGLPAGHDYGWILGQFAALGQTDVVRALLDSGMPYPGTVQALLAAGAPTRQSPPTGDETIDALLATRTAPP